MKLSVVAHVGGLGDRSADEQGWAGDPDGTRQIEGFTLHADIAEWRNTITCQAILPDGGLASPVPAGAYCGTRGKNLPLHGFVVAISALQTEFGDVFYEGVFRDGFRSPPLRPGSLCRSPANAVLVGMRVSALGIAEPASIVEETTAPLGVGAPTFSLVAHIQSRGDTAPGRDGWTGVTASRRAIEGFTLSSTDAQWKHALSYQAVAQDGTLGPVVHGGGFCGTRGNMTPMHGFLLIAAEDASHLRGLIYQGAFADGFRSQRLAPGMVCTSPTNAALVAMRVAFGAFPECSTDSEQGQIGADAAPAAEPVRMVIWDLDETFWGGTLTEGGIAWRAENAEIVRALALRGIPSTICSKNDPAAVRAILEQHGLRDFFVFPSISWEPKGPRLADLVTATQLRQQTLLFIDDNPMNRAEAKRFVPGLQVADETFVPLLLDHPGLQGKPDPEMRRLAQYQLLERRSADQAQSGSDTSAFLRDSNITVSLEYDLEPHIDRAIELINRTNQLNFTKSRLPEKIEHARMELRDLLAQYDVQGAIVSVRDKYGDYGYCGIYIVQGNEVIGRTLLQYAFSCRILGMGVETWLYRSIGRPKLEVVGDVLTDIVRDLREVDWIRVDMPGLRAPNSEGGRHLAYVFARGGCELHPLSHYFTPIADQVIEEFTIVRGGQQALINHSLLALQVLQGADRQAFEPFAPCGFRPEDFDTFLARDIPPGPAIWLLNFTIEEWVPYYRHKQSGGLLPMIPGRMEISSEAMMRGEETLQADPAIIRHLRENFEFLGRVPEDIFKQALRTIFARVPQDASAFVLLANTRSRRADGRKQAIEKMKRHNEIIFDIAAEFENITLLSPEPFMAGDDAFSSTHEQHFDRMVYYRLFVHIMQTLRSSGRI